MLFFEREEEKDILVRTSEQKQNPVFADNT